MQATTDTSSGTTRKPVASNVVVADEHERRFLVGRVPHNFMLCDAVWIIQAYLEDDRKTRLRQEFDGDRFTFVETKKMGEGITRKEANRELSRDEFESLLTRELPHLRKTRFYIPAGNHMAELNIFHDKLAGYMQIEVEFASHEEAVAFTPLSWFGEEVTDDIRHSNAWLAKHGIPPKD